LLFDTECKKIENALSDHPQNKARLTKCR